MKTISSALLATGLVATSVFALALPAAAHDGLVESTPSAGETLTALPEEFSVTMSEDLLDLGDEGSGFGLLIRDAEGLYYGDGCVSVDGPTMSAAAVIGEAGEYTLIWQVVSSDGHPTSDELTFEWAPTDEFEAASGSSEAGDCNGRYARDESTEHDAETEHDEAAAPGYSAWLWAGGAVVVLLVVLTSTIVIRRRR